VRILKNQSSVPITIEGMAMKRLFILVLTLFCMGVSMELNAQSDGKILVAYFSWGGNTGEIAQQIHQRVGGDIFEIVTVNKYPTEYTPCGQVAKREQQQNARPTLTSEVTNMASYDTVFIGYPCWWGTMPMALFTFLEKYNFSGKTVVPFTTHEGSGFGSSIQDIKKLCPRSNILDGFAVRGSSVKRAQNDVTAWLRKIRFVK
jgi:flavodoxin